MTTKTELLSLIDAYASKKSLCSYLEATRIAVSRKDRGQTDSERKAVEEMKAIKFELQAALNSLPIET